MTRMAKAFSGKKPQHFGNTIRVFLNYLGRHKFMLGLVGVLTAVSALANLLGTYMIKPVVNGILETGSIPGLVRGVALTAAIYAVGALSTLGYTQTMVCAAQKVLHDIRRDLFAHLQTLPLSFFDSRRNGELMSLFTNDVDTINNAISQNLTSVVTQITTAVGVLVMMLAISPALTVIPVVMVPLSLLSAAGMMKASETYYGQQQDLLGALNGYVEEMYNGQQVVQAFNHQKQAKAEFRALNEALRDSARKAEVTAGSVSPITTLVNDMGYVVCAAIGCLWAIAGKLAVGSVQAMLEYTWRFAEPFSSLAGMVGSFGAAMAAGGRIFALLDAEEEVPDPQSPAVPREHSGRVVFHQVQFGYTPDRLLMKGVDLAVEPGQKVAIVGPTGAGKTTLINLLMRFYELSGGSIQVDGVDIRQMSRAELRDRFGMVLQDTWLFEGAIADNIAYGEPDMDREKVIASARSACAHSFIKTLPGGYDMVLSKGAENISQGERQLITIARAIASDPEILILDEATSNVDVHTEVLIQKAMAELMKGRTSFVIAHRLSTIRDADMILYMEDGDIQEMGGHEELLARQGRYAALYHSQFG